MNRLKLNFEYGIFLFWISWDGGFFDNYEFEDDVFNFFLELIS